MSLLPIKCNCSVAHYLQPRGCAKEAVVEVTREVVLEAPLDDVWEALTDPEQLEEWFTEDGEERELVVEEVETHRRVSYTWEEGKVAIEVEEVETGTRVVVTETGEPGWNAVFSLRSLAYAYA
jgi:uncharacterized protein YndB with AHSA1/START domain